MIHLGLLSFSDGRERVHRTLAPDIQRHQEVIKALLEGTRQIDVTVAPDIVHSAETAGSLARQLDAQHLDGVVFNIPVFAFPSYAVIAAQLLHAPIMLFGPRDPRYPGLGGLLGAAGALNQVGVWHKRLWAAADGEDDTARQLLTFARAAAAATRLRGQVYGLIGGRSIGMYTGAAPAELWQKRFGIDIDHVDQSEIVRRARLLAQSDVDEARHWLERSVREIRFDGVQLTPEKLDFEVRCWLALQEIIDQFKFSFAGIKCHFDMSEFFSVQCLGAAFLNDPYDWRGPKAPVPLACEADSDGALTIQMLTLLSGKPSCLLDVRYVDAATGAYVMPNCGAAATWFAGQSSDPAENLRQVRIVPAIAKYAGGGAHLEFVFAPARMTFARLSRSAQGYGMLMMQGETETHSISDMQGANANWPHAFVRLPLPPHRLIDAMQSNHLHGVAGDCVAELELLCDMLDITATRLT